MSLINVFLFGTVAVFMAGFLYFLRTTTLTKKVIAIDFMSLVSASIMAVYAVAMNNSLYLDIIMVWALVNFLGTVGFATYINRNRLAESKNKGS